MKNILILLLMVFVTFNRCESMEIDRISVFEKGGSEAIIVIVSTDRLIEIVKQWNKLKPVKRLPNTNWTHQLKIEGDKSIGGTWLYNSQGYIARLNYMLKPMYSVSNIELFNKLLIEKNL